MGAQGAQQPKTAVSGSGRFGAATSLYVVLLDPAPLGLGDLPAGLLAGCGIWLEGTADSQMNEHIRHRYPTPALNPRYRKSSRTSRYVPVTCCQTERRRRG